MRTEKELLRIFKALPLKRKAELIEAMKTVDAEPPSLPDLMTDDDLCRLLDISPVTMRKHLRCGPPRRNHPNSLDLRLLKPAQIGAKRFWNKRDVNAFLAGRAK